MVNGKVSTDFNTAILPIKNQIVERKIRILLVDDSQFIRKTLRSYLETQANFEIVGSVDDAQTALEKVENLKPDIVLMDIEMPGMNGLEASKTISEKFSQTKVILLSIHQQEQYIKQAIDTGAKSYLLKNTPLEELVHSIIFVNKGYTQFSPGLLEKIESNNSVISSPQAPLPIQTETETIAVSASEIQTHTWSSQTKELIDTVPKVWTRGLLYLLAAFTAITLPWAMFSQVDETASARGRLEPKGKTFILDAPVAATVAEVQVKEGEAVKAGQNIVKLESELVVAELQQQETQLEGQKNRLHQLELHKKQLLLAVNTQKLENQSQKLEKQSQLQQARQQLQFLENSYDLQQAEKLAQVEGAKQSLAYGQTAAKSAQTSLNKAQKEIERYRTAWKEGIISEVQVVEQEKLIADAQQKYDKAQSDVQQARLSLAEQQSNYGKVIRQAKSDIEQARLQLQEQEKGSQTITYQGRLALLNSQEQLKNIETEITTIETEIDQTKSKIAASQYQLKQRTFKAPISGIVFDLPLIKSGEVVQAGEMIAEIAPENSPLVVRAQMATTESGFLTLGMPVKLKFDAYPFQDYGIAPGELVKISPTSKLQDTQQGQAANYNLEIKLDRDCLPTAKKCLHLKAGDTVTAEVIVRQRRVIDFILDPFKKLQKGGLDL